MILVIASMRRTRKKRAFIDGFAWNYAYCCAFRGALYAA